jgi:catechol 2,3-dioxygenase-like lactoylglutathione lyase family enzyme
MAVRLIHGPIVSCADLASQRRLFEGVFGLKPVAEQAFDRAAVTALWGLEGHGAKTVLLETPGTHFGVRLVQFDPISDIVIRNRASGFDCDALKVIDFYAPDFDAAHAHVRSKGFTLKDDISIYDMPQGRFIEGHLWGPDEVVTALISGPRDFFRDFATVTGKLFSEPQSISAPVADQPKVVDFYDKVLGLPVVHEYFIDDPSFSKLVGTPHKLQLRAKNIGLKRTEPYFGIIHYGLPPSAYASLRAKAVFPHRGLVGATLFVDHIQDHAREARAFGVEILSPIGEAALAPYGKIQSFTLRAPHGVVHHLIET